MFDNRNWLHKLLLVLAICMGIPSTSAIAQEVDASVENKIVQLKCGAICIHDSNWPDNSIGQGTGLDSIIYLGRIDDPFRRTRFFRYTSPVGQTLGLSDILACNDDSCWGIEFPFFANEEDSSFSLEIALEQLNSFISYESYSMNSDSEVISTLHFIFQIWQPGLQDFPMILNSWTDLFRSSYLASLYNSLESGRVDPATDDPLYEGLQESADRIPKELKAIISPPEIVRSDQKSLLYKLFTMDMDGWVHEIIVEYKDGHYSEKSTVFHGAFGAVRFLD